MPTSKAKGMTKFCALPPSAGSCSPACWLVLTWRAAWWWEDLPKGSGQSPEFPFRAPQYALPFPENVTCVIELAPLNKEISSKHLFNEFTFIYLSC